MFTVLDNIFCGANLYINSQITPPPFGLKYVKGYALYIMYWLTGYRSAKTEFVKRLME